MTAPRDVINPWTWQEQYGFVHANALDAALRLVICAGQSSADDDGKILHAGDMEAQLTRSLDNLETVLEQAGTSLANVVRLNYYTTDVDGLLAAWGTLAGRLAAAGCRPASTLLGVNRLAFPEMMIEIEATAVAE
jgi:enamine deaminase RidA (YjgF/YER057c/UK114 family)